MPARGINTRDYSEEARDRLATAHKRARRAAGFKARTRYAEAAGVALRSIVSLEKGDGGVGEYILEEVGRFLPTWTEDTARIILEGGPIPPNEPAEQPDLVRIGINALADIEVKGASVTIYNQELNRWKEILADEDVDLEYVRLEAHRVAAERLARRVNEAP